MNTEILLHQTMQQIAVASSNFQVSEISRLNKIAERISEIRQLQQKIAHELSSLAAELKRPPSPQTDSENVQLGQSSPLSRVSPSSPLLLGPIAITIDWSAVGISHPKQIICERKGSDTLRVFFEAIHDRFGPETLARLVAIRANRAPLISRQPQTEFLNAKQGVCYQHQQVGTTEWHVLTHSSTPEKIGIIRQVARALRFPSEAVSVQEVDLKQQMETLLN